MANFSEILTLMVTLFSLIIVGYVIAKLDIIDLETNKKLSGFILNVTCPALILNSVLSGDISSSNSTVIVVFICSLVLTALLLVFSFIIPVVLHIKGPKKYVYKYMTNFSNIGFMGFPVILSIYGPIAVFYTSIFNIPFSILVFSYGVYLAAKSGNKSDTMSLKKCINPGVISALLAVVIFATKIKFPAVIINPISLIGSITTPLSMIVIGISLSALNIKYIFEEKKMYLFILIKMIVIPFAVYTILSPFDLDPVIKGVTVILSAMPVAVNAVIMANQYDGDVELSVSGVFLTTLFSVISIPIITTLL